jgi:hypothetical protein
MAKLCVYKATPGVHAVAGPERGNAWCAALFTRPALKILPNGDSQTVAAAIAS